MSATLSNLEIIYDTIFVCDISISPSILSTETLPSKINNDCCITFCDIYNDFSKIKSECSKASINKNTYHLYGSLQSCITKLQNGRKNNDFGTIYPKNIQWKFLNDIQIKSIENFGTYFVFNKYPILHEVLYEENQKIIILKDFEKFKNKNIDVDIDSITCFISKSIMDLLKKYKIEFIFKNHIIIEDNKVIPFVIEYLMGKTLISGDQFENGFIKIVNTEGKENNILHATSYNKNILNLQCLRGGIVEYNTDKQIINEKIFIFCENLIGGIYINDEFYKEKSPKCYYHNSGVEKYKHLTNILKDFHEIKYEGKKFIEDENNALKTHTYRFKKFKDIINFSKIEDDHISEEYINLFNIVATTFIKNIRTQMYILENKDYFFESTYQPSNLGRAVSSAFESMQPVSNHNSFLTSSRQDDIGHEV
jgi:hypothetical protein